MRSSPRRGAPSTHARLTWPMYRNASCHQGSGGSRKDRSAPRIAHSPLLWGLLYASLEGRPNSSAALAPDPGAHGPHAADCPTCGILEYSGCGAIGPVLKHGPRSYTLPRVEGGASESIKILNPVRAAKASLAFRQRATECSFGGAPAARPSGPGLRLSRPWRLSDRAYTREVAI